MDIISIVAEKDINGIDQVILIVANDYDNIRPEMREFKKLEPREVEGTSTFYFGINSAGVTSFGVWYDDERFRPGPNDFWSSSAKFAEEMTGIEQEDITIIDGRGHRMGSSMTISLLNSLLQTI